MKFSSGYRNAWISKKVAIVIATLYLVVPLDLPKANAAAPNSPSFAQATLQIVVDNDYAAFLGDENNANQLLYQNNVQWNSQISSATAIDIAGSDTQTYVYVVAMGGGGTEDYGGKLNGLDITGISGAQFASTSTHSSTFGEGSKTNSYLEIRSSLVGYSSGDVANGTYDVVLSNLQSALSGSSWSAAVATGSGNGVPPNYKTSGVGCGSTSRCWDFPSDQAVVFRYPISSLGTPVTSGNKQVIVKWSNPSGGGTPTNFIVQYKKTSDPDSAFTTFSTPAYGINTETVTALTNGVNYSFRVAASNDAGTSAYTAVRTATPTGPPDAPTALTSTVDSGTATISFTDPASNGGSSITNYQYSLNNGATWTSFSPSDTSSPVTITGLTNGTSYTVRLRAINALGNGDSSTSLSVTPGVLVTFESNGGSGSMGTQFSGVPANLNANNFTRTYFSFTGWNTSADGSGTHYANQAPYAFASNATLYAQWSDTRKKQLISLSGDTLDKGQVIALSAYGYSGTGSISYSLQSGDCTLRSNVLTAISGSGTCQVGATIDADATYQSATTTATFNQRTRNSQTINFTSLNPMATTSLPQNLLATSTSGLVVSFASNTPAVCVVINGTVRTIGRGSCSVTASQTGNSTILPAPSVTQNFTVTGLPQTITFAEPNSMTTISEDQAISATSSVGLSVNLRSSTPSVCSVSSNAVVPIAAGVCIITASQPGDSNYEPALDVSRNISITYVAKLPQNITISPLSAMIAGEPSQVLSVTSSTRTRLQITVNPASVCSLDSQKKIIPIAEGQCIVTAAQEETRQYLPAISSVTLSIFKSGVTANRSVALQWIRPAAIDDKTALGVNQLNATASVPGSFVYSPSIGTILPGGIHDLTVTFTPTDRSRFLPTTMTVKILVLRTKSIPSPAPSPSFSPENKVMLPQPKTINFVSGSSKLTTFDQSLLRTYADLLKQSGVTEVTVAGFTDNVGRENLKLSTARAKVVKEFLIRIFPTLKVNTQSFGSSNPVASNESDAGKALNRRVTITPIR